MLSEVLILAATIMAEAAGEPLLGKQAVASVIHNRADGQSLSAVCLAPYQFSCWNAGEQEMLPRIREWVRSDSKEWRVCLSLARSLIVGTFSPVVNATHYFNPQLCSPAWGQDMDDAVQIGLHLFGKPARL